MKTRQRFALLLFTIVGYAASPALLARAAEPAKIALVQYSVDEHFGDYARNRETLTNYAAEAARAGAALVMFPEGSLYGYDSGREIWCRPGLDRYNVDGEWRRCRDVSRVAEPVPGGESTNYWAEFAKAKNIYIVFHLMEKDGSAFYNTLVAVSPAGAVTKYRKRALYAIEEAFATRGGGPSVLETPFGKFGMMICLDGFDTDEDVGEDLNFGFYREYQRLGVDAILNSMNWGAYEPSDPISSKRIFENRARRFRIDIYAADAWDGTAKYRAAGGSRERNGLAFRPLALDGISYHDLRY